MFWRERKVFPLINKPKKVMSVSFVRGYRLLPEFRAKKSEKRRSCLGLKVAASREKRSVSRYRFRLGKWDTGREVTKEERVS